MSEAPKTQRAWVYRKTGKPSDVLKLESDHPVPTPQPGEVLIRVKAAALNPIHWKFMSSSVLGLMQKKPAVPESDFSGTVAGGDLEGSGLKIGDEVFGITAAERVSKSGLGTMGQYTVALVKNVVPKPENLSWEEAASCPLACLTAYEALFLKGKLKSGQRVFINGGSGGVGAWAVQLAKNANATVVTTNSPRTLDFVQQLSPTVSLDYTQVDLPSHLATGYTGEDQFDVVFDTVGSPELFWASHQFLKKGGAYVDVAAGKYDTPFQMATLVGSMVSRNVASFAGLRPKYTFMLVQPAKLGGELKECAEMLEHGTLKAYVDKTFAFEDALEAYKHQMTGRSKGKVVVLID